MPEGISIPLNAEINRLAKRIMPRIGADTYAGPIHMAISHVSRLLNFSDTHPYIEIQGENAWPLRFQRLEASSNVVILSDCFAASQKEVLLPSYPFTGECAHYLKTIMPEVSARNQTQALQHVLELLECILSVAQGGPYVLATPENKLGPAIELPLMIENCPPGSFYGSEQIPVTPSLEHKVETLMALFGDRSFRSAMLKGVGIRQALAWTKREFDFGTTTSEGLLVEGSQRQTRLLAAAPSVTEKETILWNLDLTNKEIAAARTAASLSTQTEQAIHACVDTAIEAWDIAGDHDFLLAKGPMYNLEIRLAQFGTDQMALRSKPEMRVSLG